MKETIYTYIKNNESKLINKFEVVFQFRHISHTKVLQILTELERNHRLMTISQAGITWLKTF